MPLLPFGPSNITRSLLCLRPNPVPFGFILTYFSLSSIPKGWNNFFWSHFFIPIPVSQTEILIMPCCLFELFYVTAILISTLPFFVNFKEFPIRLKRIWRRRFLSDITYYGTWSPITRFRDRLLSLAFLSISFSTSWQIPFNSTFSLTVFRVLNFILQQSKMLFIWLRRR